MMRTESEVKLHYDTACIYAEERIEALARGLMRLYPGVLHEFIIGMGVYFFIDEHGETVDDKFYHKSLLAEFIFKWDEYLKLTGNPMRFTIDGSVVRNW